MIQECSVRDTHSDEPQLRRCLSDLIAFRSLPLVWKDKTPREIADELAGVLESTLGADFILLRICGPVRIRTNRRRALQQGDMRG
jgi:hypothetical protein